MNWTKGRKFERGAFGQVHMCTDNDNPGRQLVVKLVEIHPDPDPETEKLLCIFLLQ